MVIYKIIGGGSILVSALILYFESQSYNRRAIKQLQGYINFIEYAKNQINSYLTPINIIIENCELSIINNCTSSNKFDNKNFKTFLDMVESSSFYIEKEIVDLIYSCAKEFGSNYRQEQIKHCDFYIQELTKEKNKLMDKYEKDKKVRFALCICLSFSLILLLV